MALERNEYYRDLKKLHDKCKKHMYYHTILTMADGSKFDGIVEDVDMDNITVLVGEDVGESEVDKQSCEHRQYYHHDYDYDHDYGYPRRRFRRFRRQVYPLSNLIGLSLLPYIAPISYPFYNYYY